MAAAASCCCWFKNFSFLFFFAVLWEVQRAKKDEPSCNLCATAAAPSYICALDVCCYIIFYSIDAAAATCYYSCRLLYIPARISIRHPSSLVDAIIYNSECSSYSIIISFCCIHAAQQKMTFIAKSVCAHPHSQSPFPVRIFVLIDEEKTRKELRKHYRSSFPDTSATCLGILTHWSIWMLFSRAFFHGIHTHQP